MKGEKNMKKSLILTTVFLLILALGNTASAQITITIPKIPKIKKNKPQPPQTESPTTTDNNRTDNNRTNDNQSESNRTSQAEEKPDKCETDPIAGLVKNEITKMSEDIDGYTPGRGRFYSGTPTYNYLLFAVSPSAKQEWDKNFKLLNCPKIAAGFEKLSASATKKLPLRLPDKANYSVHNLAEEKLMKSKINDLANHKIFYSGITEANWLIDKNSIGIPTARYKHGMVWVRYAKDDHPYCRVYFINIVQDYARGGTYGASYGNFVDESLVGCPAGK